MRKFPWLCFLVVAMLAPAVLHAQAQSQAPAQGTAPKPATTTHPTAAHATTDLALLNPALLKATAPPMYEVTFVTTKGPFVVRVTRAWAPLGADRFYNLVRHHFFDGTAFFRVVPDFMVQFGLSGNPAVNRAMANAKIKDDPVTQSNKPGFITFATAGPGTRTTQVFINYVDNSRLDREPSGPFAPFGQVTSGMDVVKSIYSGDDERPDQGAITNQGNAYLSKAFPNLDKVKTATVTSPLPAAPVRKPAAAATPAKKPAAAPQQ